MRESTSRRDFMRQSIGATAALGGAGTCLCALGGCASKTPHVAKEHLEQSGGNVIMDLAKIPELESAGGSVLVKGVGFPDPVIVIHAEDGTYKAFSAKCTHFGMAVSYDTEGRRLRCGSIGHSTFDLDGNVTKGPAKKPLRQYSAVVEGGKLTLSA